MFYKNPASKRQNPFYKIYRHSDFVNVLKNKDKISKFPFLVDIELTNHCNLNCLFCGQQAMTRKKGFMPEGIFRKAVDESAKHQAPLRMIRWGEPFLHPKILDFLAYAKNKNLLVHVTTNGLLLDKEKMRTFLKLKLDSLIFSMQGATKKEYSLMRNNPFYEKLKKNIIKLVKLRGKQSQPYIHISCTVTNETKIQIKKFLNFWGIIVDSVGMGRTNLSRFTYEQIKKFETIGKLKEVRKQETIKKIYRPCTEVYQKLSIDWDGKVSACCSDHDNYLTVGDLNKETLGEIWLKSERLQAIRTLLASGGFRTLSLCRTCFHAYEEF